MPRRYRRRRSYAIARPMKKYSNETYTIDISTDDGIAAGTTQPVTFTSAATVLGTRKAKNFTLNLYTNSEVPFYFALVYVPEGTQPSALTINNVPFDSANILASASLYEPNQNVIISGFIGGLAGEIGRFKSRLARNLNSNDSIVLLVAPVDTVAAGENATHIVGALNYAISY